MNNDLQLKPGHNVRTTLLLLQTHVIPTSTAWSLFFFLLFLVLFTLRTLCGTKNKVQQRTLEVIWKFGKM